MIKEKYTVDFVKDGEVHLKAGYEMSVFNLHNLIGKCVDLTDKSKWSDVIMEHFNNIFISIDEQKKIDPSNFETVKKYLSLRIYPEGTVQAKGAISKFIARVDLEGTYTLLMLDLPGAFKTVEKEMFTLWQKDTAEVFKIAQYNINKQQVEKITREFDADSNKIEISFIGNEDYAASYALDLMNNSPELLGEWGSVLAIPNKGLVDICKVSKEKPVDFVNFIRFTHAIVDQYFQQHAQPVSNQFFWYYKGKFTRITVVIDDKQNVNVVAPFGLMTLMTENK